MSGRKSSNERMSEEEYKQLCEEVEELKAEITRLRDKKNVLLHKCQWYRYSAGFVHGYEQTDAYKWYGKRLRDLTPEERREYNKRKTAAARARRKEQ